MSSPGKRLLRCAGVAAAAAASLVGSAEAAGGAKVSILDSGFKPAVVTVKQWQVVTWTNEGKTKHGVASEGGAVLGSGDLDPGQAYANLFTRAGTFAYHDSVHPQLQARVIVVAAPKPTVTGSTPPRGRKPKGFHPKPAITSASPVSNSSSSGTNWTAIGAAFGATAVVLAAAVLLARRRLPGR